jgi:hypothetical protein
MFPTKVVEKINHNFYFVFHFFLIYVQRRLIFSRLLFNVTTRFGLNGHGRSPNYKISPQHKRSEQPCTETKIDKQTNKTVNKRG